MRLTHISVEGCGRFQEAAIVSGLDAGLNVLAAPNEAGKSTLFKAVRTCIFEKHTATARHIQDLACNGVRAPITIELGFLHDGSRWTVRKTYLSGARASLERDGKVVAQGRAADEELLAALGLKSGSGRGVDAGALGLLWVAQSQSFDPPKLEGAARDALESAISGEVGRLVGGERARDTLKKIDAELQAFQTDRGQVSKNGLLGIAEARRAEAKQAREAAETLLRELERDVADLERKRRDRAERADPQVEADLRRALAAARAEHEEARRAAAQIETRARDEELARRALEQASAAFDDLQGCARRIDETQTAILDARGAIEALARDEADCAQGLERIHAEVVALEERTQDEQNAEARLARQKRASDAAAAKPGLERRLARLEEAAAALVAAKAGRARILATPKDAQALDALEREAALIAARLESGAPRVELAPEPGAAFEIAGERIDSARVLAASGRIEILAPGVGRIVVAPPAGLGEDLREKLREAQKKRADLLAQTGAADAAALRAMLERAQACEQEAAAARAQLQALDSGEAQSVADREKIRGQIARADAAIAEASGPDQPAPTPEEIEDSLAALRRRREVFAEDRKRLQTRYAGDVERRRTLAEELAKRREKLAEAQRRLDADLARLPPPERAARLAEAGGAVETARKAHEQARISLEAMRAAAPDADRLAQLDLGVTRREKALDNHRAALETLGVEIGQLEGRIQSRGGEGLGERVETLREEEALAGREAERHRARMNALVLLRETVRASYEEQRERLQAPIRKHLQPFLHDVFPSADLGLDEGFGVTSLTRGGPQPEAFDRLSDGTKEQIAVLVRLAMGGLLHERGEDVPIILDDALVFCDDERIEHMFDALNRAARRQQVIVLTCRGKSFRSLGGTSLRIEPRGAALT